MDNSTKFCCEDKCCNEIYKYAFCKKSFCCDLMCFNIMKITHVDGKACNICNSFGYCTCNCKSYIKKI